MRNKNNSDLELNNLIEKMKLEEAVEKGRRIERRKIKREKLREDRLREKILGEGKDNNSDTILFKRKRGFLCIGGPALFGGVISGFNDGDSSNFKLRLGFLLVAPLTGGLLGIGYLLCWLFLDKE